MATYLEDERPSSQLTKLGVFLPVLRVCRQVSEEAQMCSTERTYSNTSRGFPRLPTFHSRPTIAAGFGKLPALGSGILLSISGADVRCSTFLAFARVLASTRPSRHYTRDFHLPGQTTPASLAGCSQQAQEHHVP